jgi:superfamily II DNA or RNA helicase
MIALRDYQQEAIAAIIAAARRGIQRQLVVLPTGTGKTVCFVELIRQRAGRSLVLVHRDELLRQTVEKLALVGLTNVGIVKAEQDQHAHQVVVASVQTLSRETRLARLIPNFTTLIPDEAHHSVAESYQRVFTHCCAFESEGPLVIGWTATADRGDGIGLGQAYEEIVYEKSLVEMIQRQYLCDLKAQQVQLAVDFNTLHVRRGDFVDREAEALLLAADAPQHVLAAYQQHAAGRTRTILFTPTVKLAHAMADVFTAGGLVAAAVDAETPIDERRAILAHFAAGEIQVVANCGILTEGYDCPPVDCVIIAKPTKSRPLYVQMVGRGTRRYPGKPNCLILDCVGVSTRHDLQTAASLFGVDPDGTITTSVVAAIGQREAEEEQRALEGRIVSQRIDLFKTGPLGWATVSPIHFILSMATAGDLHLVEAPDGWQVQHRHRAGRREVLARALTVEYAMGTAEDVARKLGPAVLIDRTARWRSEPASERQLALLRRWRVPHMPTITRGEATELLTVAGARRHG